MTYDEYILNPMGKKSSVLNVDMREIFKLKYRKKLDTILLREHGKIDYFLFIDSKANTYWVYIKIPSEVVNKFYYDVVIKFSADEHVTASENLFKYKCQFYSNDPAFVFTYANVFSENDLFIPELKRKMSTKALKEEPKEKNPNKVIGYVKTLYFAYIIMQERGLNKLNKFKAESAPLNVPFLLKNIMDADEKINDRQEAGRHIKSRIKVDEKTYKYVKNAIGQENIEKSRLAVRTTKTITPTRGNTSKQFTNVLNGKTTKTTKTTKRKK